MGTHPAVRFTGGMVSGPSGAAAGPWSSAAGGSSMSHHWRGDHRQCRFRGQCCVVFQL